jgi:PBP1b-binding outer membrane lipoprotein LpoB
MRTLLVSAVAGAALLTAGCSASTGDKTVDKSEVAKQAQVQFDRIARQRGATKFPTIKCPKDLKAKKGATTRCSAKGTDGTLGITVTVTSVKNDKAQLHFKGDSALNQ